MSGDDQNMRDRMTKVETKLESFMAAWQKWLDTDWKEVREVLKPRSIAEGFKLIMEIVVLVVCCGGIYMSMLRKDVAAEPDPDVLQKIIDKSVQAAIQQKPSGQARAAPAMQEVR
jgi:hypothetical protein